MNPGRAPHSLSAPAALAAWLVLIIVLNLSTHPLLAGAVFGGLAITAWRTGRALLILVAAATGVGMLMLIPGVAVTGGGFDLSLGAGAVEHPGRGWEGIGRGALAMLRVPAQVLAVVVLLLVPTEEFLRVARKWAPRSGLLAGLVLRIRPLLMSDVQAVRDHLVATGHRFDRRATWSTRLRSAGLLYRTSLGSIVDRASDSAVSLRSRGYGAEAQSSVYLGHARSGTPQDRIVLGAALLLLAAVVGGRTAGLLGTPQIRVFGGATEPFSAYALGVALLAFALAAAPVLRRERGASPAAGVAGRVAYGEGPRRHATAGSPSVPAVRLQWLTVSSVGGAMLLDVPHLELATGRTLALVGPSGSGKSLLLRAIAGVLSCRGDLHVAGVAQIGGQDVDALAPGQRVAGIGLVLQDPERQTLMPHVEVEVAFPARNAGVNVGALSDRVRETLEELGCGHLVRRSTARLSGGELQLVALAAALAPRPKVLLLDEPVAHLDDVATARFWEVVARAGARFGTTTVIAGHNIPTDIPVDQVLPLTGAATPPTGVDPYEGIRSVVPGDGVARLHIHRLTIGSSGGAGSVSRTLVSDLTAMLTPGTVVALTGGNGCGKTTLLRALRGLHPLDAGAVMLDGLPITVGTPVSYLAQSARTMFSWNSVLEEVRAVQGSRIAGPAFAMSELESAGLADQASAHPLDLSGGARQRLALIVATATPRALWLLDEPTRGMDDAARRWLALRVSRHVARGGMCVIATHDRQLVRGLCARVIHLGATMHPPPVTPSPLVPHGLVNARSTPSGVIA